RDLCYLWVSKPYADWIGRPAEELVGRPIREVIGPEAFEQLGPFFARVLAGEPVQYEEAVNFRSLGPRWISAVYPPAFDAAGVPDGWVAVVIDLTERRRAEERLRQSEGRLQLLWEAATVLLTNDTPDAMLRGLFVRIGPHLGLDAYFNFLLTEAGDALR